ncbi:helicase associated domain-containing protein [Streptomyces sp. NPDC014748]|uniref:helicase associated domain-containing protein n=1 Tax=Streptomyces sp. NPDC014748 TaxID=3364905 RepID=UPI0036FEA9DE
MQVPERWGSVALGPAGVYEALWLVTAALRHHNQSIAARAPRKNTKHRLETDAHQLIARRFRFDFTLDADRIARVMDLVAWPSDSAVLPAPRRAGLAAAVRFHAEHGRLRVPTDYEDAYGYRLRSFFTGRRSACRQDGLTADWITELEVLGMAWDENQAAWQANLAAIEAFHAVPGPLRRPRPTSPPPPPPPAASSSSTNAPRPAKTSPPPSREQHSTALDPNRQLPHGPDWHRKYHLLRRHIQTSHDPATLRRDLVIDGVKAGGWLHRQFTNRNELADGQRDLLTRLGLTPDQGPLPARSTSTSATPGTRARRRSFQQTAELLRLFVERWGRPPNAREGMEIDGEHVMIGPCLRKVRTKQNLRQRTEEQDQLMTEILKSNWTTTDRASATKAFR